MANADCGIHTADRLLTKYISLIKGVYCLGLVAGSILVLRYVLAKLFFLAFAFIAFLTLMLAFLAYGCNRKDWRCFFIVGVLSFTLTAIYLYSLLLLVVRMVATMSFPIAENDRLDAGHAAVMFFLCLVHSICWGVSGCVSQLICYLLLKKPENACKIETSPFEKERSDELC